MARNKGELSENNFIGGVVTEVTPLTFPPNSCLEALNVEFDRTGRVSRRKGLDFEEGVPSASVTISGANDEAVTEYLWKGAGGDGEKDFVVVQHGSILHFWDASDTVNLKNKKKSFTVNLEDFKALNTSQSTRNNPCEYAHGQGDLLVVSRACDPFLVYYDSVLDVVFSEDIVIKERDFKGLGDGLDVTERPVATLTALKSSNPAHFYNLINQGWWVGGIDSVATSAINQWDTARTDLPSNGETPGLYRASESDNFDPSEIDAKSGANSPSPKGHFLLSPTNPDRLTSLTDAGYTGLTSGGSTSIISRFLGDEIGNFTPTFAPSLLAQNTGTPSVLGAFSPSTPLTPTNSSAWFDGSSNTVSTSCTTTSFPFSTGQTSTETMYLMLVKDFGAGNAIPIHSAEVAGSNNVGYASSSQGGSIGAVVCRLYGSNTAPTSAISGGTLLGTTTFTNTANESTFRTISSSDTTTTFRYLIVQISCAIGGGGTKSVFASEARFYTTVLIGQAAFDGVNSQASSACTTRNATSMYIGKDYGNPGFRIASSTIRGSNNTGFGSGTVTLTMRGSNVAPTGSTFTTEGVSLGTLSFTDTSDESAGRTITSTDTSTFYRYVWIVIQQSDPNVFVAEVEFVSTTIVIGDPGSLETPSTAERYQTVVFSNGRVFYSGIATSGLNNKIFFTEIIQDRASYGKCYQRNDPTSEYFFDLLPSDGGVINIPEMGSVVKLFAVQSQIMVFANNGVWIISGSQGQPFSAVDYTVKRLSNIGVSSKLSFIDFNGFPLWWAEDGISTVEFDPRYDSYSIKSITDKTFKSFILAVPSENRKYVKGCYSPQANMITWIYNNDFAFDSTKRYVYNRALRFNTITSSFSPWSFLSTGGIIKGVFNLFDAEKTDTPIVKFVTINSNTNLLGFSEVKSQLYIDFPNIVGSSTYESYFDVGDILPTKGLTEVQPTYVVVYTDQEADGSCFMQGQFNWTTSGNSGKWSRKQQIYSPNIINSRTNYTKLKVRGNGKAVRLHFESKPGKPFSILGWNIPLSANQEV